MVTTAMHQPTRTCQQSSVVLPGGSNVWRKPRSAGSLSVRNRERTLHSPRHLAQPHQQGRAARWPTASAAASTTAADLLQGDTDKHNAACAPGYSTAPQAQHDAPQTVSRRRLFAFLAVLCTAAALLATALQGRLQQLLFASHPGTATLLALGLFFRRLPGKALALASKLYHSQQQQQPQQRGQQGVQSASTAEADTDTSMLESVDEGPAPPETSDELDSVQSPASVWLPYKENTGASPKAQTSFIQFGPTAFRTSRVVKNIGLLMKLPGHIVQVIAFKAQQIMLGSTWSKLVAVFVVGIPAIAFGGALYSLTSGKSLTAGLISAYGALYKIPGVTVIGEVNAMTEMLMHVIWMVGTFTFAIVLGVVTEDIVNTVMAVRSGNYPVLATNHTLILNWNNQTVPLLKQIAIHKTERNSGAYKGPVVILADRDKEDMDAQLRSALKGFPMEWHTRKGAPYNIVDLQRVAAGQARTIILLDPATEQDPGKKQVAAVLGIQTARATTTPRPFLRLQPQTVAVQEPEDEKNKSIVQAARNIMQASAQKLRLTDLSGRRDMSVLLAHSAVAPGVASVYCTIVQQSRNGVEFYIKDFPELSGLTYGAARRCFDRAIICGYIATDTGALCINPPDSDMMHAADRFVALAATGYFRPDPKRLATVLEQGGPNSTRPATHVESSAEELLADAASSKAKSIVVAWWDDDISDLCNSLSMFAPKGTTVTIVSETKPEGFPDEKLSAKLLASCKFAHIQGDPAQQALLKKAGVANAHAIIVGGVDSRPPKEGDALTLSVILLLNDVMVASGRDARNPVHIVGTVRRPETVEVANFLIGKLSKNTVTAELLQPDELVSGMISQVAAEPDMGALLAGFLYNVEGQEIHLRRPSRYLLPKEQPTSFAQITELARQRKETAIGYITKAGAMTLAPSCGDMHVYTPADRVVVIAEE